MDDFNLYYDVALKRAREARLSAYPRFQMVRMDVADGEAFKALTTGSGADRLGASGRHRPASAIRWRNPFLYERANIGRPPFRSLEACRHAPIKHLVYASSSSVYGERAVDGGFLRERSGGSAGLPLRRHETIV